MKNKNYFNLLAIVTLLLFCTSINAKVWRVNNNDAYNNYSNSNPNDIVFENLQTAVDYEDVEDGDTLYVEASAINYMIVNLNKRLTLIGAGYFLEENTNLQFNTHNSSVSRINFGENSSGSKIYGLRITGSSGVSIGFTVPVSDIIINRCYAQSSLAFNNGSGSINNLILTKNYLEAISASGTGTLTINNFMISNNYINTITLKSNTIATVTQNVIQSFVNIHSGTSFFNNICLSTGNNFFTQNNNTASTISHNIFFSTQTQLSWLNGGNNNFSNTNSIFLNNNDTTDKKYQLKSLNLCQVCYNGTPENTQIGMYGGNDPYILSGIPAIPTIYSLQASSSAPQGGTLQTTISTRSNN